MNSTVRGSFEISKNTFDCLEMYIQGIMHKLIGTIHTEDNFRSGYCDILKPSDYASIQLSILNGISILWSELLTADHRSWYGDWPQNILLLCNKSTMY